MGERVRAVGVQWGCRMHNWVTCSVLKQAAQSHLCIQALDRDIQSATLAGVDTTTQEMVQSQGGQDLQQAGN